MTRVLRERVLGNQRRSGRKLVPERGEPSRDVPTSAKEWHVPAGWGTVRNAGTIIGSDVGEPSGVMCCGRALSLPHGSVEHSSS